MENQNLDSEGNYQIKNNQAENDASVSFTESLNVREVYIAVHFVKKDDGAWFHTRLLKDGKNVRTVKTHTNHGDADKDYDLVYKGTIAAGSSPTFRAEVVREARFNSSMKAHVKITGIAVIK